MLVALTSETSADRLTLAELAAGLRNRALGFVLLLFALPCCFPTPPGLATACGIVIASVGIHLIIGREYLWLPGFVARRSINRSVIDAIVTRALPPIRRLERMCRPRLEWASSRLGRGVLGFMVLVMAILIVLPIPLLGNLPPGIAASILAIGLIERDGLVISVGGALSVIAVAVTGTMAWAAIQGMHLVL